MGGFFIFAVIFMKPIGIFDSGYGGLTVLREIRNLLPQYDYLYLGDNARTPYGTRSFETVYRYTKQCVKWMLDQDCHLVILACNTASAKALRTIQQKDLPGWNPEKRILGVIRPTAEVIGHYSKSGKVGILATNGTVNSGSYSIEIAHFFPDVSVFQQACPLWVPLIENNLFNNDGADFFIRQDVNRLFLQQSDIDTILLGCTHYPLIADKIKKAIPGQVQLLSQGEITATSLQDYLKRHPEIDRDCSKGGAMQFFTTDATEDFDKHSQLFFGEAVQSTHVDFE